MKKISKAKREKEIAAFLKSLARLGGDFVFKGGSIIAFVILEGSPIISKLFKKRK